MLRNRGLVIIAIVAAMVLVLNSVALADEGKALVYKISPEASIQVSEGEAVDLPTVEINGKKVPIDLKMASIEEGKEVQIKIGSFSLTITKEQYVKAFRVTVVTGTLAIWAENGEHEVFFWPSGVVPSKIPVTGYGPPPPVNIQTPTSQPATPEPTAAPTTSPTVTPTPVPTAPAMTVEQVAAALKADPNFVVSLKGDKGDSATVDEEALIQRTIQRVEQTASDPQYLDALDARILQKVDGRIGAISQKQKSAPTWPLWLIGILGLIAVSIGLIACSEAKKQAHAALYVADVANSVANEVKEAASGVGSRVTEAYERFRQEWSDEVRNHKLDRDKALEAIQRMAGRIDALEDRTVSQEQYAGDNRSRVAFFESLQKEIEQLKEMVSQLLPKPAILAGKTWQCPGCKVFVKKTEGGGVCHVCGTKYLPPAPTEATSEVFVSEREPL